MHKHNILQLGAEHGICYISYSYFNTAISLAYNPIYWYNLGGC